MRVIRRFAWCLATAVVCSLTNVATSEAQNVDVAQRAQGAQKVVVAKVTGTAARWHRNEFGDRLIVSELRLAVEETLKGTSAAVLSMDIEGGTLDGVTLRVSSSPQLKVGERAIFYLEGQASGSFTPHLKEHGVQKLDSRNLVLGSGLHLDDVRRQVHAADR